jgi:hypothetical protein
MFSELFDSGADLLAFEKRESPPGKDRYFVAEGFKGGGKGVYIEILPSRIRCAAHRNFDPCVPVIGNERNARPGPASMVIL